MDIMNIIIPIVVFMVMVLIIITIFTVTISAKRRKALLKRIESDRYADLSSGTYLSTSSGSPKKPSRLNEFFTSIAIRFGNFAKPENEENLSRVQENLMSLGYRKHNAASIFFGIKVTCAITFPALFFLLLFFVHTQVAPLLKLSVYVLCAGIGFYLPEIWIRMKIVHRKEKILEGFPDALDMLVVCVEAGMGLDSAIDRVAREMSFGNKPISEELMSYNREMRIGKSRRDALKSLARRVKLDEVGSLVTLLIQTDKFGTSIAQSLRAHSDFMRIQRQLLAEEKAAKIALKLLFPMIFFIFPSLFVIILGPAVLSMLRAFEQ